MLRYIVLLVVALGLIAAFARVGPPVPTAVPRAEPAGEPEPAPETAPAEPTLLAQPSPLRPTTADRGWMEASDDPDLLAMHRAHVEQFVEHDGFGASRITSAPPTSAVIGGVTWQVRRRLIGIVNHDEARLYEPHDVTMRRFLGPRVKWSLLDEADARAVELLKRGSELAVSRDGARAVGAIRARDECLECHESRAGDLLGALRYDLSDAAR